MARTKIEWSEMTWNPISGCTKVSEGCRNCYAERMAKQLAGRYGYPEQPHHFDVTLHPDKLDLPLKWRKPRRVFVVSMGDLFHEDVPFDFIERVYGVMAEAKQHTFQVLTKRPRRAAEFLLNCILPSPRYLNAADVPLIWKNVWLGVSVEDQATANERIPLLLQTPAAVRFVSCEPLLEAVDLVKATSIPAIWDARRYLTTNLSKLGLHWVICGGESGPGARPMHPNWARSLRDQCQQAGVPFFFKQHGAWLHRSQMQRPEAYTATDMYCWTSNLDASYRVRKKAAGRILDGRTWDEMPGQELRP